MANPFDQFDAAPMAARPAAPAMAPVSGNPFDQFDDAPMPAAPSEESFGDFSLRTIARTGKNIGQGVASSLAAVHPIEGAKRSFNFLASAYDKFRSPDISELVTGKQESPRFRTFDEVGEQVLDHEMLQPQNAGERIGDDVTRGAAAALTGAGGFRAAAQAGGGRFINMLAAKPAVQAVSGAVSGGASGGVREAGGGRAAQIGAGLAAGMLTGPRSAAIPAREAAATKQAREMGITLDPNDVIEGRKVGSITQRAVGRAGGKADLPAEASLKNQEVVQAKVAEDIGLPKGERVTPGNIEKLRKEANKKYDELEKTPVDLDPDVEFFYGLHTVRSEARSALRGGKTDARIDKLIKQYEKPLENASVGNAMKEVRTLRANARKRLLSDDVSTANLGAAERKVADVIENMIERQLAPTYGKKVAEWRKAREQLAKLHLVEDSLDAGGTINARVFGEAVKRGDPVTGNMRSLGQIADNFPRVMQSGGNLGQKAGPGLLDIAISVPTLGAWAIAREVAKRRALSSTHGKRTSPVGAVTGTANAQQERKR